MMSVLKAVALAAAPLVLAAQMAAQQSPIVSAEVRAPAAGQCAAPPPLPAIPSSAPPNSTYLAAGKPIPMRFRGPIDGLKIDLKSAAEVNRICAGGQALCGRTFLACARGKKLIMPNPCDYPGQPFADLFCHEVAHENGWPATHGD